LTISHPDHIIRYCGFVTMAGRLSKLPSNAANAAHVTSSVIAGGDLKERAVKQYIVAELAAALIAGGLIDLAPRASAGCLYGGYVASRCDGPVQPDGTRQRCVVFNSTYGAPPGSTNNYGVLDHRCDLMGPDLHPWGTAFNDPPTHIDD
jgi:hypothetical protein